MSASSKPEKGRGPSAFVRAGCLCRARVITACVTTAGLFRHACKDRNHLGIRERGSRHKLHMHAPISGACRMVSTAKRQPTCPCRGRPERCLANQRAGYMEIICEVPADRAEGPTVDNTPESSLPGILANDMSRGIVGNTGYVL